MAAAAAAAVRVRPETEGMRAKGNPVEIDELGIIGAAAAAAAAVLSRATRRDV